MLSSLAAFLVLAAAPTSAVTAADSAAADTASRPGIVRQFPPIVVTRGRREDPGSLETVRTLPARAVRGLPVDRLADAVALQAGVVALGEDLHVRGGRAGELAVTVAGVPLNDPQSGRPMEVPLFSVRSLDLLSGGADADRAGSLAGELDIQTEDPAPRPAAMARWVTGVDGDGGYDAGLLRASLPLGIAGLGIAAAGEARFDDLDLPVTRTREPRGPFDVIWDWRHDNRMLAWAKVAPIERPQRGAIEVFASRTVVAPYNPMFTFDGYVTPTGGREYFPYVVSEEPLSDASVHVHAADHAPMTDERRIAVVATRSLPNRTAPVRLALGFLRTTSLTSVGLARDPGYVSDDNRLAWGAYDSANSDPYLAYVGDPQEFTDRDSRRWTARADALAAPGASQRLKLGAGFTYDEVRLRDIDAILPLETGFPSLRSYHAWAPGGFAYAQHRWEYSGLIWNAGMRVQAFTAGPQADSSRVWWTWSPRLGFAYPVSDRDAFSASYARIHQDPARDLLYDNRELAPNSHPLGYGGLEPAEVISYQAAVRHLFDAALSLQFGVFFRDVYGQPGVRNAPTPQGAFRLRYASEDEGHAGGVELSLRREWGGGQRVEASYTFMNAWGTQSNPDGLQFGPEFGSRPLPLGTHPLDWDIHHTVALSGVLNVRGRWSASWSTLFASGRPWTPLPDTVGAPPGTYTDENLINSRRLPWSETTDVAIRWSPKFLRGLRALFAATNLFDERGENRVTLSGDPNPVIGTAVDEYGAYRTQTGLGGGAYYDGGWTPVHDRRLAVQPRSVRLGLEAGQ